jgi:hypothetical protein
LWGVKILSMPSFRREVKQFVPCRRFAARDKLRISQAKLFGHFTLEVPSFANGGLQRSSRFGAVCRGASTLEQHGCPLELKGGNQSDAVHKGTV